MYKYRLELNKNSIEELKAEVIKMESWKEDAKTEKELKMIQYFININNKMISILEGGVK